MIPHTQFGRLICYHYITDAECDVGKASQGVFSFSVFPTAENKISPAHARLSGLSVACHLAVCHLDCQFPHICELSSGPPVLIGTSGTRIKLFSATIVCEGLPRSSHIARRDLASGGERWSRTNTVQCTPLSEALSPHQAIPHIRGAQGSSRIPHGTPLVRLRSRPAISCDLKAFWSFPWVLTPQPADYNSAVLPLN